MSNEPMSGVSMAAVTAAGSATERVSQISQAISDLWSEIKINAEYVDELNLRLEPIMRPPVGEKKDDSGEPMIEWCKLAGEMKNLRMEIRAINATLDGINKRIEL